MGVNEEKISLLRAMMLQAEVGKTTITLTREEWQRVEQMSMWIANAVAQAIEHQPYVSQNVLEHAVARVVAMVLKLNVDMFGKAGGDADHMAVLIRHEWKAIKDKKIDYQE